VNRLPDLTGGNARSVLLGATLAATALLGGLTTGCEALRSPSKTGLVKEVETGRNGVKVEVYADPAGNEDYEVYLAPGMQEHCEVKERLTDCADADDYLVPRAGARLGAGGGR
jgi:hypothetical protein